MSQIIKIDPTEYGLAATEAEQVKKVFIPMIEAIDEIEKEFNQVISLPISPENVKTARELRLRIVKIRTGTDSIHKKAKEYYLNGGRFVDGIRNTLKFAITGKEDKLEEIENYYVNLEKERIQKLHKERVLEISQYMENCDHIDFGNMDENVFKAYLEARKKEYEDKIEAEKKAREEQIKREQEQTIYTSRLIEVAQYKYLNIPFSLSLETTQEEYDQIISSLKEAKALDDEKRKREQEELELKREEQKKLEENLRIEREERAKAERELEIQREEQRKADDEKLRLEREAFELEMQERKRQLEEKQSQERREKEVRYKEFLKNNNGKYDVLHKDPELKKVTLYKIVAEFTFE